MTVSSLGQRDHAIPRANCPKHSKTDSPFYVLIAISSLFWFVVLRKWYYFHICFIPNYHTFSMVRKSNTIRISNNDPLKCRPFCIKHVWPDDAYIRKWICQSLVEVFACLLYQNWYIMNWPIEKSWRNLDSSRENAFSKIPYVKWRPFFPYKCIPLCATNIYTHTHIYIYIYRNVPIRARTS